MRGNFSPARNVRSTTPPASRLLSFVRTNAPPLPGFTCWNSTIRHTLPSSSMCMPFLKLLVSTCSATMKDSIGDRLPAAPAATSLVLRADAQAEVQEIAFDPLPYGRCLLCDRAHARNLTGVE